MFLQVLPSKLHPPPPCPALPAGSLRLVSLQEGWGDGGKQLVKEQSKPPLSIASTPLNCKYLVSERHFALFARKQHVREKSKMPCRGPNPHIHSQMGPKAFCAEQKCLQFTWRETHYAINPWSSSPLVFWVA